MPEIDAVVRACNQLMDDLLDRHGQGANAVGWPNAENQKERFRQLALFLPRDDEFSIIDVGCGLGHLFDYLVDHDFPVLAYTGIDINPRMVQEARTSISDPRAEFVSGDYGSLEADFVVGCGIFNIPFADSAQEWSDVMREEVRKMWKSARRGIAFNSLTTYVDWRDPSLFYTDPAEWLSWVSDTLSPNLALTSMGPLYEWTISVNRGRRR